MLLIDPDDPDAALPAGLDANDPDLVTLTGWLVEEDADGDGLPDAPAVETPDQQEPPVLLDPETGLPLDEVLIDWTDDGVPDDLVLMDGEFIEGSEEHLFWLASTTAVRRDLDGGVTITLVNSLQARAFDRHSEGWAGNDRLAGSDHGDRLMGLGGNDTLAGGDGTDSLFGGSGDDHLHGGTDTDRMRGGDGDDTFMVTRGFRLEIIVDFDDAGDDAIQAGFVDRFADLEIRQKGDHTLVISDQGTIRLLNTDADTVGADDFLI